ncbi:MAG: helix-turn-helix domain-containing protein [Rhodospirillales bacterium]
MTAAPITTRYLRTAAAAEYLDCSASKLNKLRSKGGGPAYAKIGAIVVYNTADLDEWVVAHRRTSTSDGGATPPRRKGGRPRKNPSPPASDASADAPAPIAAAPRGR